MNKTVATKTTAKAKRRGPRHPVPELMGATEVAETLGVRISNLQHIRDLPEPDQIITAGRLWRADTIRDFAKLYEARRRERLRSREAA